MTITARHALYIKLGQGGEWEDDCLSRATLRFGYRETPHELCIAGRWSDVQHHREQSRGSKGAATSDTTQIRYFYEAGKDTIWITFAKHALWWCFADSEVRLLPDQTKERSAVDGWRNTDATGRPLLMSALSGQLLATQGFRGTICTVKELDYLLGRINGTEREETRLATQALSDLASRLEAVIRSLTWKDFELLVDLLFRQAGWQRVSSVGSTIKDLDLELISPMTQERVGVQVKARANRDVFEQYRDQRLLAMEGFSKFFFAVHSPALDLIQMRATNAVGDTTVELLLPARIAELAANYGLAQWIIDKAR